MMTAQYAVDSLMVVTPTLLAECLESFQLLGPDQKPFAWFRYTSGKDNRGKDIFVTRAEIELLETADIACFPIARVSSQVCKDRRTGENLARQEVARLAALTDRLGVYDWLDVEMDPPLSKDFWLGWSEVIAGAGHVPCAYMPNKKYWPKSWESLSAALEEGATCGGTWPAWYIGPVDGSARIKSVEWDLVKAAGIEAVPTLLWQFVGNANQMHFDFSLANPNTNNEWQRCSL